MSSFRPWPSARWCAWQESNLLPLAPRASALACRAVTYWAETLDSWIMQRCCCCSLRAKAESSRLAHFLAGVGALETCRAPAITSRASVTAVLDYNVERPVAGVERSRPMEHRTAFQAAQLDLVQVAFRDPHAKDAPAMLVRRRHPDRIAWTGRNAVAVLQVLAHPVRNDVFSSYM